MNHNEKIRKKILGDYYEILLTFCSQKISEILAYRNNIYQLPKHVAVELFDNKTILEKGIGPVQKTEESILNLYFLMAIIEKTASVISFDETGDQIIIDKDQLYKLPIEEKYFEDKIKALAKVKKIIHMPVWQKIFMALILANKERKDFNELTLLNEITFIYRKEIEAKKLN